MGGTSIPAYTCRRNPTRRRHIGIRRTWPPRVLNWALCPLSLFLTASSDEWSGVYHYGLPSLGGSCVIGPPISQTPCRIDNARPLVSVQHRHQTQFNAVPIFSIPSSCELDHLSKVPTNRRPPIPVPNAQTPPPPAFPHLSSTHSRPPL